MADYERILSLVEHCFEATINTYILLGGSGGNGRSNAVYYVFNALMEKQRQKEISNIRGNSTNDMPRSKVSEFLQLESRLENDTQKLILIEADSLIYDSESKMLNFIHDELRGHGNIHEESSNTYAGLLKMMGELRVMLYIKHIEVFAEASRQVFLYTLLDTVNTYSQKVTIIFSTDDLFFVNSLEKRVKSRFSFHYFCFNQPDYRTELLPIIHSRLNPCLLSDTVSNRVHPIADKLIKSLERSLNDELLSKYHLLGMSVKWFLQLFKNTLLVMSPKRFLQEAVSDARLDEYVFQCLSTIMNMLTYETKDAQLLSYLPRPAQLIIMILHDENEDKINGLSFERFKAALLKGKLQKYNELRGNWNFEENVIKDSLLQLKKMNYVHIDRTPITAETVVKLTDRVSSSFISCMAHDSQIHFK